MLTNDVQTVERLTLDGHFIWLGLLETIVVLAILWYHVGVTILLAVIYTCFVLLLQIICGKFSQLIWYDEIVKINFYVKYSF
jgi:hypothetical protein